MGKCCLLEFLSQALEGNHKCKNPFNIKIEIQTASTNMNELYCWVTTDALGHFLYIKHATVNS